MTTTSATKKNGIKTVNQVIAEAKSVAYNANLYTYADAKLGDKVSIELGGWFDATDIAYIANAVVEAQRIWDEYCADVTKTAQDFARLAGMSFADSELNGLVHAVSDAISEWQDGDWGNDISSLTQCMQYHLAIYRTIADGLK